MNCVFNTYDACIAIIGIYQVAKHRYSENNLTNGGRVTYMRSENNVIIT